MRVPRRAMVSSSVAHETPGPAHSLSAAWTGASTRRYRGKAMSAAERTPEAPSVSMEPQSVLQSLPLLDGLSSAQCAALERRMPRRDFIPQTIIVREGTADDSAFFIL